MGMERRKPPSPLAARPFSPIIPAKAGTQAEFRISHGIEAAQAAWVPAFAGMVGFGGWGRGSAL
jgi:hypothetical protein